jgi:transglutaminase-like putative cysteine protease
MIFNMTSGRNRAAPVLLFCVLRVLGGGRLSAQEGGQPPPPAVTVIENFDGGIAFGGSSLWTGSAEVINAASEIKVKDIDYFENSTSFVKFDLSLKGKKDLTLTRLSAVGPSVLSFRYRTEIAQEAGQSFKVFVDDDLKANLKGLDIGWRTEKILLTSGVHQIRFEAENLKGTKIVGGYNAVYIDDVIIFPDLVASITMHPRGVQETYSGAAEAAKIKFTALALHADGSVKNESGVFSWAASGGAIDANGLFTPSAAGTFTVTAKLGNYSVISSEIIVHATDFLKRPYTYPGTGKTYNGYLGTERAQNAPAMPSRATLSITSPAAAEFDADGFFLIEGAVRNEPHPRGKNYARILVHKVSGTESAAAAPRNTSRAPAPRAEETFYIVQNNFTRRIWLPFGAGEYRIEVIEFDNVSITSPPVGEGMFRGGSYSQQPLAFTVYNTREEADLVDGDGRWLYPSFNIESDDFRVSNLLHDITAGLATNGEKIKAVHDYLVSNLVYDTMSFSNAARSRRMNSISVIENRTAVCDGYSNLSAALLRCAGIPVKFIANRQIAHSWNNVYVDGAWKFYDATWDDPVPDKGPGAVQYTYFLPDDLRGGDNRHRGTGNPIIGDVE